MKKPCQPSVGMRVTDFIGLGDANAHISDIEPINHGGRRSILSTTKAFEKLLFESGNWNKIINKLKSHSTMNLLLDCIQKECSSEYYAKWLLKNKLTVKDLPGIYSIVPNTIAEKWKKLLNQKVRELRVKAMLIAVGFSLVDSICRVAICLKDMLFGERRLAFVGDYSVSNVGYEREIHRDSDSRVIVFILYLNNLEDEVDGGGLQIHGCKTNDQRYQSQPDSNSVYLAKEIKPGVGKFVMFLNTARSYHSVPKMSYSEFGRHFIYGALTLGSGISTLARIKSKDKLPTEYFSYRG